MVGHQLPLHPAGRRGLEAADVICEPGTGRLKPSAEAYMWGRSWNEGGNCMGFSTSSGLFYVGRYRTQDYPQPGVGTARRVCDFVMDAHQYQPEQRVIDHVIEAASWLWAGAETQKIRGQSMREVLAACRGGPGYEVSVFAPPMATPCWRWTLRTRAAAKRFKRVDNATAVIWKLLMVAERSFRRLNAAELLPAVWHGAQFVNGVVVENHQEEAAA